MAATKQIANGTKVQISGDKLVIWQGNRYVQLDAIEWYDLKRWVNRNLENSLTDAELVRPEPPEPVVVDIPDPPKLVLIRLYPSTVTPFVVKRKVTSMWGVTHTRGSKITTFEARYKDGGMEINLFSNDRFGLDGALALISDKPAEAHLVVLTTKLSSPEELETWVLMQLSLKATKRLK